MFDRSRAIFGTYLGPDLGGKAAEDGFVATLRNLCFLVPHRTQGKLLPSHAWDPYIGPEGTAAGLGLEIGILFGDSLCCSTDIAKKEAYAITKIHPPANGNELKHFDELLRSKRNRPGKQRARTSMSSKRNKRKTYLLLKQEQWGEGHNDHARQLRASEEHIIERYNKYARRQITTRKLKERLTLTFRELYVKEQMDLQAIGPISTYQSTILMVKAISDYRTKKWFNFFDAYSW